MQNFFSGVKSLCGLGEEEKEYNFPPCIPFLYHSISDCERRIYLIIMALVELVAANWLGTLFSVIVKPQQYVGLIALSSVYLIFVPCCVSFFVLYWSLYKACLTKNIIRFVVAIIIWGIGVLWMVFMAIGSPVGGACGILSAIGLIDTSNSNGFQTFTMIYHFCMAPVFLLNGVFMLVIVICLIIHAKKDGQMPLAPKQEEQSIESQVTGAVVSTAIGM